MVKDNLNGLIMNAMKAGDKVRTSAYRAIKTAIMQWDTAKENVGKTYDEAIELNIIKKLVAQYKDTAEQCNDGKHDDIVQEAQNIVVVLNELLPAPISEETIYNCFGEIIASGVEPIKKNMGFIIKEIKAHYPSADGKLVSQVVSKNLQ